MRKKEGFDISEYKTCSNCTYAKPFSGETMYICSKKGVVKANDACKKFEIDLLSFRPRKLRTLSVRFTEDDFSL